MKRLHQTPLKPNTTHWFRALETIQHHKTALTHTCTRVCNTNLALSAIHQRQVRARRVWLTWGALTTHTYTHSCWFPLTVNGLFSVTEGTCHFSSHTHCTSHRRHPSTHRKLDLFVQRSVFEKRYQNSSRRTLMQIIVISSPHANFTSEWHERVVPSHGLQHIFIRVMVKLKD